MQLIDADGHVEEGEQTWQYLDPEFHPRRPVPVTFAADTTWGEHNGGWLIDYKLRKFAASPTAMLRAQRRGYAIPSMELTDVAARLADMDRAGIEKQVIYPSSWLGCLSEDLELEIALARSYNQFMATQCNQSGGRLFYGAVLPYRSPEATVEEIRRVGQMGNAVSIFMRGLEWDIPVTHPMFWPVYEEAERQDLVIGLHTGFGSPTIRRLFEGVPRPKPDPFPHIHPLTGGLQLVHHALACVVSSTVLEDFPRLRWALLETGSEWVVPAIRAHSRRKGRDLSRYFREGRMYVTCEPDEELSYVVSTLGEDCLVAASDMPHGDAFSHAQPAQEFAQRGDLSEQTLQKLLQDNARKLYRI